MCEEYVIMVLNIVMLRLRDDGSENTGVKITW
jgi:hypothetical protein